MFNLQGDTTFINGKVVKKYLKDRCAAIDIEMTGINQRGELSSPGFATVMLPARDINTKHSARRHRVSISICRRYDDPHDE